MIKMFDYNTCKPVWETVLSYDKAVNIIKKRFYEYWLEDRDDCYTYVIELFYNDKYEVWFSECGSWSYDSLDDEDSSPYHNVYYGSRDDDKHFNFTKLNPNKDYIII